VGLLHRSGRDYPVQAGKWTGGETNPAVRPLPPRNFDLAFTRRAANTTCCALLKQPDKQKLAKLAGLVVLFHQLVLCGVVHPDVTH
jgi:hypothetical protein